MSTGTPAPSAGTSLWRRRGFRRLWAYNLATSLQDGAMVAAGPLIVATVDRSPAAVSAAFTAQAPRPTLLLSALMFAWFTVFGAHEAVWSSISTTIRQLSVPAELMGRVMSVYLIGVIGGAVIGLVLGGALGQWLGWQNVFWLSGALSLAGLVWMWGRLPAIAHTGTDQTRS